MINSKLDKFFSGISPLALHDNARTVTSVQGMSAQKTVTIVSPRSSDQDFGSKNPFVRRYNSDIESVSSRSSSSLDKASSDGKPSSKVDQDDNYKWDFDDAPAKDSQDEVLTAIVQESDAVTRAVQLRKRKDDDGGQASATRKPSIASIEPWDSHSRKTSTTSGGQEDDRTETTGRFSVDKHKSTQ